MKLLKRTALAAILLLGVGASASAQYYDIINQATNMLSTALSGGANYRGMVDVSYLKGLGNNRADFIEITTTQGVNFASWFYLGVGAGVSITKTHVAQGYDYAAYPQGVTGSFTRNGCMIPLYSDFRFDIGSKQNTGFYADIRLGGSFLVGKSRLQVGDGYITKNECFYLKPSVGARVPLSKSNSKLAANIGLSYTLVVTDMNGWYYSGNDVSLNGLGASIGIEW